MSTKARWFWPTFLVWLAIDQATKLWIYFNLQEGVDVLTVIPGFFDLVHAENPGAAFSLLRDFEYRHVVFVTIAAAATVFVGWLYRRLPDHDRLHAFSFGLILAGAVGNGIDRVWKRTVTDFLRVYIEADPVRSTLIDWFGTYEWPSFNVADSTLLVGVVLYVLWGDDGVFAKDREAGDGAPSDEDAGAAGSKA